MDKMKDLTFRDAVWLALIIFGAGASYMMLSSRLEAVEQKANTLEEIVLKEIPEMNERLVRLETKMDLLLKTQSASLK
jgi:hypothetical protein